MLNEEIIKELIEGKLDKPIRLFASMESAKDIAIIVAAFANTKGGYLLFGVQYTLGENRIIGLAQDFKINTIMQEIPNLFEVVPDYEYGWIKIQNERPIFAMKVNKSKEATLVQGNRYEMHENEIVKVEGKKRWIIQKYLSFMVGIMRLNKKWQDLLKNWD